MRSVNKLRATRQPLASLLYHRPPIAAKGITCITCRCDLGVMEYPQAMLRITLTHLYIVQYIFAILHIDHTSIRIISHTYLQKWFWCFSLQFSFCLFPPHSLQSPLGVSIALRRYDRRPLTTTALRQLVNIDIRHISLTTLVCFALVSFSHPLIIQPLIDRRI